MPDVITDATQLTPDWLTRILQAHRCLDHGVVTAVRQRGTCHMASLNFFLEVDYTPEASASAPLRLFFKMSRPENLPLNASEVDFYTVVAAAMPDPPIVHCYHAAYSPDTGAYHILLEDMSHTHRTSEYPLPPTRHHAEQIVDALAALHAFWWDHDRLGADVAELPTEAHIQSFIHHHTRAFPSMIDFMGDRLSRVRRCIYEKTFAVYPELLRQRAAQGRHLTLVHGDANAWNFLLPRNSDKGRAYIIDRQLFAWMLPCWTGVSDLAYLMVHWWYPERRHLLEKPLLQRYHEQLQAYGILHYDWEALWYDYRLAAIRSLYVPLEWFTAEDADRQASTWYPQLENALAAFDDLACAELLAL